MPRFRGARLAHNLAAVGRFDALAIEIGLTSAQLALAWLLTRGSHVIPIPGTRSIAHLEENIGAARVALSPETLHRIDAIFARGAIQGARYSAAMQRQIDTEVFADEELEAQD
jgi:aryl-alcohol dehydrogenase-like predicted oxidoreductase